MKLSRSGLFGLLLIVYGLASPIASAPAQTDVLPSAEEGRKAKWEDPLLGIVCTGNCPGTLCCSKT